MGGEGFRIQWKQDWVCRVPHRLRYKILNVDIGGDPTDVIVTRLPDDGAGNLAAYVAQLGLIGVHGSTA